MQFKAQECTSSDSSGYSVSTKVFGHPSFQTSFHADRVVIGPTSGDMYVFIYAANDTSYYTYIMRQDYLSNEAWSKAYSGIHAVLTPVIRNDEKSLYYLIRDTESIIIHILDAADGTSLTYK